MENKLPNYPIKWEVKSHSYQIADTGDYDGYWEITNGKDSLITKEDYDDIEKDLQEVANLLNNVYANLTIDRGDEFALDAENKYLRQELEELMSAPAGPRWVKGAPKEQKQHFAKVPSALEDDVFYDAIIWPIHGSDHWWCVGDGFKFTTHKANIIAHIDKQPAAVNQDAHEMEIMMRAFDKVRQIFEGRQWVMDGRGSYPYNDDRYKEEVRYMYDEFDQVVKDTWANIRSKSIEYREKIIAEYLHGDHPAIHDILRRIGYQRIDATPAGREEGTDVFVPCAEDDPDRCGGYTSDDGRSLCYVKVQHVPISALKQKEGK